MNSNIEKMKPCMLEALDLAKSLGASAASVMYVHDNSRSVSFEANRLKSCSAAESQSYSISMVINHRRGVAVGNVPESMPEAVRRAAAFAANGAVSHFDEYPAPAEHYLDIKQYSPEVPLLTTEKMVSDAQMVVDKLLEADSSLVSEASVSVREMEASLVNTAGFSTSEFGTGWAYGGGFQKTTGTDMLFSGSYRDGVRFDEFYSCDELLKDMLFDLKYSKKIVKAESGNVTLVIPPEVIEQFLSPVISGINGRNVFKGVSPLRDKIGTQCFSSNMSILDNPHIDYLGSSSAYDNVGIPTEKRMLIENGVLNCFLYDYDTACMAGVKPTGNSGCAPYTTLLTPGNTPSAELIKNIDRGIYVKEMIGFGQTNMINGDFSANLALGFLVDKGEIVGRVKDTMISGNIFELLKGDVQFSSDVNSYYMQPYTILPGVALKA